METYSSFLTFLDTNLIFCLIPMIITLALADLLFGKKAQPKKALRVICWIIILYSAANFLLFILSNDFTLVKAKNKSYGLFYWVMFLSSTLLPLTLLIKKISSKYGYVLLVAFLLKLGVFFEYFVIIMTSRDRDFVPDQLSSEFNNLWIKSITIIFLQGLLLAIFLLLILKAIDTLKNKIDPST